MEFKEIKEKAIISFNEFKKSEIPVILVGSATCGIAAGASKTLHKIEEVLKERKIQAKIYKVGCIGACFVEPLVDIIKPKKHRVSFFNVTEDVAEKIIEKYLIQDIIPKEYCLGIFGEEKIDDIPLITKLPFFKEQIRIVLRNCGFIDPENILHYIARGGYSGLSKALENMTLDEVIDTVKKSGLRGRGGAGFPTGLKWEICKRIKGDKKFVICNADEGDPGAFMDRNVLESDPHSVLEGMLICGYAIGSDEGYIYTRAEYPLAIKRLKIAISQMKEFGLLGEKIFGSSFNFNIKIKEGAGAFVCGEETALIASIEGKRGMPSPRPPFPAEKGLFEKPTVINNVETFANVSAIFEKDANWFANYGTEKSKGTKVFALAGKVKNTGLIEVPMGISLKDVIYEVGGGIVKDKSFKAVQTGGPSGGCIPEKYISAGVDYEQLTSLGSIMGSGGMIVMDNETCMVDIAKYFLSFTTLESCGKCTPCRIGTKRMLEILIRITEGKGEEQDLEKLIELGEMVKDSSLCGLGQTAPNPALTTLKYFRDEYEKHINDKKCPAGVCRELIQYFILKDKCTGCGLCKRLCSQNAIRGTKKKPHKIIQEKCIKCGSCIESCKFSAIKVQ